MGKYFLVYVLLLVCLATLDWSADFISHQARPVLPAVSACHTSYSVPTGPPRTPVFYDHGQASYPDFISCWSPYHFSPPNWGQVSECCNGNLQSPIPLSRLSAHCMGTSTPYYSFPQTINGKLRHSGKFPKWTPPSGVNLQLSNVGNNGAFTRYVLAEIHMHFGGSETGGSEHTIEGECFAGEIHMVHYKEAYGSMAEAMGKPDGLAVIGVVLSPTRGEINRELDSFISSINKIPQPGQTVEHPINPNSLLPMRKDLFYYDGSLTNPPCYESVQFMIMTSPLLVTHGQLMILWQMQSDEGNFPIGVYGNARPLQPTNNRDIYTNFFC